MRRLRLLVASVLVLIMMAGAASTISAKSVYAALALGHVRKSAWGRLSSWTGSTVSDGIPLYDAEGSVIAWGFDVLKSDKTLGYVIVNAEVGASDQVFEFGIGGGLPFSSFAAQALAASQGIGTVLETRYLYPSALTYAIQTTVGSDSGTSERIWLRGKGLVTKDEIGGHRPVRDQVRPATDFEIMVTEEEFVPGTAPDYAWYRGCAPTAAGNLLAYWDSNGYPAFPTGTTLIDELADAMGTEEDGDTYLSDMPGGILDVCYAHEYTDWDSWNDSLGQSYSTYTDFKNEIQAGRPLVASLLDDATYGNHSTTGIGYRYDGTSWIVIHDTWPSTPTDVYVDYYSSQTGDPFWTYVVPGALP